MGELDDTKAAVDHERFFRTLRSSPENWFGPIYIGVVLNCAFLGILYTQVRAYYSCFSKDPMWTKGLVGLAISLSTFKACQSSSLLWDRSFAAFGNWENALNVGWAMGAAPVVTALVSTSAQAFFIWRVYVLTARNRCFLVVLTALMLVGLAAAASLSALLRATTGPPDKRFTVLWVLMVVTPLVLDSFITLTISYKLLMARGGDNRNTDTILAKLLAVTWQSALPPFIVQLAGVLHFSKVHSSPMWNYLINELTADLYIFSLMYTLNSRLETRRISRLGQYDDCTDDEIVGEINVPAQSNDTINAPQWEQLGGFELVSLPDISGRRTMNVVIRPVCACVSHDDSPL